MPIARALIGKQANASNTITTPSGTSTGGSGSIGVIVVSYDPGVTISSVSDSKSNTYTLKGSVQTGTARMAIYECFNWTGGTSHTATVSFSGTAYPVLHLIEVTGAASSSASDKDVPEIETTRPASIASGVLSQANEVVLMAMEQNYSGSNEAYTSTTLTILSEERDISNYWTSGVASIITSATTDTTYDLTKNGSGSGTSAARLWSYKEAGAGGDVDVTLNDSLSTIDTLVREALLHRITADSLTIADSIVVEIITQQTVERLLQDGLSISDSLARDIYATYGRLLSDGITLTDNSAVLAYLVYAVILNSEITISDSLSREFIYQHGLGDAINVTDSLLRDVFFLFAPYLQDGIEITDALSSEISGLVARVLSDGIDIYDVVSYEVIQALLERILQDAVTVEDLNIDQVLYTRDVLTGVSITSFLNNEALMYRGVGDLVDVLDSLVAQIIVETLRMLNDSIAIGDALEQQIVQNILRQLSSSISVVDQALQDKELVRLLQDQYDIDDAVVTMLVRSFYEIILNDYLDVDDELSQTILRSEHVGKIVMKLIERKIRFKLELKEDEFQIGTKVR